MLKQYRHVELENWLESVIHPNRQQVFMDAFTALANFYNTQQPLDDQLNAFIRDVDNREIESSLSILTDTTIDWVVQALNQNGVRIVNEIESTDLVYLTQILTSLLLAPEHEDAYHLYGILDLGNQARERMAMLVHAITPELQEEKFLELVSFTSNELLLNLHNLLEPRAIQQKEALEESNKPTNAAHRIAYSGFLTMVGYDATNFVKERVNNPEFLSFLDGYLAGHLESMKSIEPTVDYFWTALFGLFSKYVEINQPQNPSYDFAIISAAFYNVTEWDQPDSFGVNGVFNNIPPNEWLTHPNDFHIYAQRVRALVLRGTNG